MVNIPRNMMMSAYFGNFAAPGATSNTVSSVTEPMLSILRELVDDSVLQLAVLVLFHLSEGENSAYESYLHSLPQHFQVPTYWIPQNFEQIHQVSAIMGQRAVNSFRAAVMLFIRARHTLRKHRNHILSTYKENPECTGPLPKLLADEGYVSWNRFRWALAVVITRQNMIPHPIETGNEHTHTIPQHLLPIRQNFRQ